MHDETDHTNEHETMTMRTIKREAPVVRERLNVTVGRIERRGLQWIVVVLLAMGAAGCVEQPTEPNVGSGNLLEAAINGVDRTFELSGEVSEYEVATLVGRFGGSTADGATSLIISFSQFNIDEGPFPTVLFGGDITMTLVDSSAAGKKTYVRPITANALQCSVTITGSDGEIVDGTFFGTLESTDDPNDVIVVMEGTFSAKLNRQ